MSLEMNSTSINSFNKQPKLTLNFKNNKKLLFTVTQAN